MKKPLKAFEIEADGKILDYRAGAVLDLSDVEAHFAHRYTVKDLVQGARHVTGTLEDNSGKYFLKLATTEGISAVTRNEYRWNDLYNRLVPRQSTEFWVPKNIGDGLFRGNLYYIITDIFEGELFATRPEPGTVRKDFSDRIPDLIRFSESIQDLPVSPSPESSGYREQFLSKVTAWYEAVPAEDRAENDVQSLWRIAVKGMNTLEQKPRHGDFTPWHIMELAGGRFGLIDGEHFMLTGIKAYDICYFIQRVYSVLNEPEIARRTVRILADRGYSLSALQTVLAARAIGGFLDASLAPVPDYGKSTSFKNWVQDFMR